MRKLITALVGNLRLTTMLLAAILGLGYAATASAEGAMTAGELQEICLGADAASKSACRFYILGITQGIDVGMAIADGKTRGGRPCVPDELSSSSLELAVKMKIGEDLKVFPDDRKLDAAGLVAAMVVTTYPCRKAN